MMMGELHKNAAYYKDSVAILGLNMNELEGFINPSASAAKNNTYGGNATASDFRKSHSSIVSSRGTHVERTHDNAALIEKIEMIDHVPTQDLQNQDIEEIGEYCVRMIGDIGRSRDIWVELTHV